MTERMRCSLVPLVVSLAGCGSAPSNVADMAPLDGTDAAPDLGLTYCEACSGRIAFLLNETSEPVLGAKTESALLNGTEWMLGQPGPPGFGASACFLGNSSFLQLPGAPFVTLGAHHTLEFVIQPLNDGLAVDWDNDDTSGWRVNFSAQTMLSSFCEGDCGSPVLMQGSPRWVAAQWYHAALVRDGTTARAYLGGELTGEVAGLSDDEVEVPPGLLVGAPSIEFQGCVAWVRLSPCACYSGETIVPPSTEGP